MTVAKPFLAVVSILLFITILFGPLGASEVVGQDMNISQDDLSFNPDIPDPSFEEIPLDSYINSENVTVQSVPSNEYDQGLGLQLGESTGFATFDLRGYSEVNVESTGGTIFSSCGISGTVIIDGVEETKNFCGFTPDDTIDEWDSPQIRFDFENADGYIYQIEASENPEIGTLGVAGAFLGEVISYFSTWIDITQEMPTALQGTLGVLILSFFGLMIVEAVSLLG